MSTEVPRRSVRFISRVSLTLIIGLLAVSLTGAVVPVGTPEDVGLSTDRLQRINQVVQRAIDANEISSRTKSQGPSRSCHAGATSRTSRRKA